MNELLAGKCHENGFDYMLHNNNNTRLHLNIVFTYIGKVYIKLAATSKITLIMGKFGRNLQTSISLITQLLKISAKLIT